MSGLTLFSDFGPLQTDVKNFRFVFQNGSTCGVAFIPHSPHMKSFTPVALGMASLTEFVFQAVNIRAQTVSTFDGVVLLKVLHVISLCNSMANCVWSAVGIL